MTRAGARRRHGSVVAAATATLLLLAGCGSDDDAPSDDDGTTGTRSFDETAEPVPEPFETTASDAAEDEPDPLAGTTADAPIDTDGSFADGPAADGTAPPAGSAGDGLAAVEEAADPSIGVASAGLIVLDGDRLVDGRGFGAEQDEVLEVLEVVTGERPDGDEIAAECGDAIDDQRRYDDLGLTVTFLDDTLVGWFLGGGAAPEDAPRTVNDVGIGSTLADFRDAIPSTELVDGSTLGAEFTSDAGYRGLLTEPGDDGTIEALWSGDVCVIR